MSLVSNAESVEEQLQLLVILYGWDNNCVVRNSLYGSKMQLVFPPRLLLVIELHRRLRPTHQYPGYMVVLVPEMIMS